MVAGVVPRLEVDVADPAIGEVLARAVVEKMLTYSLGRGVGPADRRTVDGITSKLEAGGYPFQTMIFEIVRSLPFQARRGELSSQMATKPKEIAQK